VKAEVMLPSAGGEAYFVGKRCAEGSPAEVMPGRTSGEVMPARRRQEEIEKTKSSDTGQFRCAGKEPLYA